MFVGDLMFLAFMFEMVANDIKSRMEAISKEQTVYHRRACRRHKDVCR